MAKSLENEYGGQRKRDAKTAKTASKTPQVKAQPTPASATVEYQPAEPTSAIGEIDTQTSTQVQAVAAPVAVATIERPRMTNNTKKNFAYNGGEIINLGITEVKYSSLEDTLRELAVNAGIGINDIPPFRWGEHTNNHPLRFPVDGDVGGKKSGYLWTYMPDQAPGLYNYGVGNFKNGGQRIIGSLRVPDEAKNTASWNANKSKREAKSKRQQEMATQNRIEAKELMTQIWNEAQPIPDNTESPYIVRKRVRPYDLRIVAKDYFRINDGKKKRVCSVGSIAVPIRDNLGRGEIVTLQFIAPNGEKYNMFGAQMKSACYTFNGEQRRVFIVEGWATGASVFEATGNLTIVTQGTSGMSDIAQQVKQFFNTSEIIFVADNDNPANGATQGAGEIVARKAAALIGARVVLVPRINGNKTDANDYSMTGRLEELSIMLSPNATAHIEPERATAPTTVSQVSGNNGETNEPPKKKLPIRTLTEACQSWKPTKWLVKNVIKRNGIHMIFGKPASGKTFHAISLAVRVAFHGDPLRPDMDNWNGKRVHHGRVIYIAGEDRDGVLSRIMAEIQELNLNLEDFDIHVSDYGTKIDTSEGLDEVLNSIDDIIAIDDIMPELIIVDTLRANFSGDENSSQDADKMIVACQFMQRRYDECAMIWTHHQPHTKDRARGSTAWEGALDLSFSCENNNDVFTFCGKKNKNGVPEREHRFELKPITLENKFDEDGDPIVSAVLRELDNSTEDGTTAQSTRINETTRQALEAFNNAIRKFSQTDSNGRVFITESDLKEQLSISRLASKMTQTDEALRKATKRAVKILIGNKHVEVEGDRLYYTSSDTKEKNKSLLGES